jgi:ATP-binding cassette subfamily B protein
VIRVVGLLRRSLAWIGPVRWHVVVLLAGVSGLALMLVPPGALLIDVVWTRVLQAQPLTELQARVLGIDPAVSVHVASLAADVRHAIAVRVVTVWVVLAVPAVFAAMGLWYYQIAILQWVNQHLRMAIFDRLQSLSLRFHGDARIGDAVYRLFQDSAMVTQVVQVLLLVPLFGIGRFVCSLAIVAAADPRLALVLAATWPPLAIVALVVTPRLQAGFRVARARTSDLTASIEELLSSLRVLKAYGAEAWALERFSRESTEAFRGAFTARRLLVGADVAVYAVLGGALIVATAWATLDAREGAPVLATRLLGLAGFTAWNLGCFQFVRDHLGHGTTSARQLWRTWAQAQDVIVGLERAFALLDRAPDVVDAPDAVPVPFVRDGIAVRGVSFAYEPGRPVLRDVDLLAPIDTVTAIMGPTGAGKSTLAALLLRLFDPDVGTIGVDGVNLRRIRVASLRDRVALVLQEPLLFGASVRDNIRYAVPNATDAAVRAAARVACADEFVERLPAGYDTVVGDRGTRLSAGERQRIAIARAVLKDAPVVVLDEPTAALDPATEARVLERLAVWGRGRVIVIITHRVATARRADQVVLLEEGRVVEAGTQDDLRGRPGGAYRALVASEHGAGPA